jgi:DNA helicase-2/ATP-dependent DNA helicase PcrA
LYGPDVLSSRRIANPDDLLVGCDREQVLAITSPGRPLCVLAGAGSGKTRVLTRRIAWRVLDGSAAARHVLTLTFTRKAAAELRGRLAALGLPETVTAGTFHAIALAELRRLAAERRERPPVVLSSKARIVHAVLDERPRLAGARDRSTARGRKREERQPVYEIATEIEWAKSRLVAPAQYARAARAAGRDLPFHPDTIAELYEAYEAERRRRRVLDFEDLLTICTAEMASDPEFCASARWRIRHLFVDEYQDVNAAQLALLKSWCHPDPDLCVVGDPDQAIYGWNGADPAAIHRFPEEFPGATVLELRTNYRSTGEVLAIASAVLGRDDAPPIGGPVPDGPVPTVQGYETDAAEASGVAEQIRLAHRPGRLWSQIAVLARTNAQLPAFVEALRGRGVPCRVLGEGAFLRKPHVLTALDDLQRAPDGASLSAIASDLRLSSAVLGTDGAGSAGDEADDEDAGEGADGRPGARSSDRQEAEDLAELAAMVEEYLSTDETASGHGFRSYVEANARALEAAGTADAVELMTFHRAKGLEWSVVFVVGLEDGLVPIAHARDRGALDEERRLLYVACTRAEEELHCSWARERRFSSDRPSPRGPSPYLPAIERAQKRLAQLAARSPATAREALAASRRVLAEPPRR